MEHHIFSDYLQIDNLASNVQHVERISIQRIKEIIAASKTDVYLCGGGQFAGWLLDNGLINQLKLKLNPIVLGRGIPLFGKSNTALNAELIQKESFEDGLEILTYDLKN